MCPCCHGSIRQLPDLIEPLERLTSGHDHPLAIRCPETHHCFDAFVRHRVGERFDEVSVFSGSFVHLSYVVFPYGANSLDSIRLVGSSL